MSGSEPVRREGPEPPPCLLDEPMAQREYDPADDFRRSLDAGYAHIRERIRNGGKGWTP